MDGILHLASPLPSPSPAPQATIRPAVDGTLGILKSALKNGKHVKRIGITSSSGSVAATAPLAFLGTPTTFTEADRNDAAINAVQGGSANPLVVYAASKTLAEKAAWEFHNTHKPAWDITTLNPPLVYGPTLLPVNTPADIGGTQSIWYGTVIAAGEKDKDQLGEKNGYAWVDVRDVAEAHVRSLEKGEAGGERIIVSSGSYIWQEWFNAANAASQSPDLASLQDHLPKGSPELTSGEVTHFVKFDNAKSRRVLGLKYRAKEDTARDILEDARERGWVAKTD